jgi:hypothetical protein
MSRLRHLLAVLLVAVLGAVAILAWMSRHSFRRVPQSVEVGLKGEALENSTLLLETWLAGGGRSVTRKGGALLARDLPEGGVLVLLRLAQPITPTEVETLLAWVHRGGHLLTDGTAAPFDDDRSLANLHKTLAVTLNNAQPDALEFLPQEHKEGTDTFYEGEVPYRVRRTSRWRLVPQRLDDWDYAMGHKDLQVLLTRREEQGRITLTPDLSFLHHRALADGDHAAYAQRLLALQPGQGPVVVWSRPADLSLFSWLRAHALAPTVALMALVGAWVWKGWPRFGPLCPDPSPRRRSLLEHLRASARLMWWGGAGTHLLARTREALERRAQRLNPAFEALDLGGRAEWLAQVTGGSPDVIGAALDDRPGRPSHQLVQDLIILEQLRQQL